MTGPDGQMIIGPGSWNRYECLIAIAARDARDFPTAVRKGDLMLLWKNSDTQETLGTRLYRQLDRAVVAHGGKQADSVSAWKPAAEQGDLHAQVHLASYYEGRQDWRNAVFWTRKAAAQGYAPAQYALATHFHFGRGGLPKDLNAAFDWMLKAAKQDYAPAQNNAAILYYLGDITPKNDRQAITYVTLAASQGLPEAIEQKKEFLKVISADDVIVGEQTAQDYIERRTAEGRWPPPANPDMP